MNTKVNEGKLISGKEALIALANGKMAQLECDIGWCDIDDWQDWDIKQFTVNYGEYKFRLKPRTTTLNGIEVPKSSDTYSGGLVWILCGTDTREYTSLALDENDELPAYFWRTEEEIKQVVSALRQVFGGSHDN